MSTNRILSWFLLQVLLFHLVDFHSVNAQGGLQIGFYKETCPAAEEIVKEVTKEFVSRAPSLAPALLRMHFHDCFVRGCDGSVLLNSTGSTQSEKTAPPNLTLRGFQVIDAIKAALEKACPGKVSCADILALTARDVVELINGPYWEVPTGRRDGRESNATEALNNLPPPSANITLLQSMFASKGLSNKDLVVLSGAHTIGIAHCSTIATRIYNFTGKGDSDPTIDHNYLTQLKRKCQPNDNTTLLQMDPGSSKIFDHGYFSMVSKRRGLFQSDAALLNDSLTASYVRGHLAPSEASGFFEDFKVSIVKMGQIGVLTGNAGEIRKKCYAVN